MFSRALPASYVPLLPGGSIGIRGCGCMDRAICLCAIRAINVSGELHLRIGRARLGAGRLDVCGHAGRFFCEVDDMMRKRKFQNFLWTDDAQALTLGGPPRMSFSRSRESRRPTLRVLTHGKDSSSSPEPSSSARIALATSTT